MSDGMPSSRGAIGAGPGPILFLLGPSGAGKSTLAAWVAEDLGLTHFEIDRYPDGDGIDLAGLRPEWDAFLARGQVAGLAAAIRDRAARERGRGAVLSFPSNLVLPVPHMQAAEAAGIRCLVLFGTREECLGPFLRRERGLGRGLDVGHWLYNNAGPQAAWAGPDYATYRLAGFAGPDHRTRPDLVTEVRRRLRG